MKAKSVVLLAVAVGCGLVAMLGVQQVLRKEPPKVEEMGRVLTATADVVPGTPLDDSNTAFKAVPKAAVPEGAVTTAEQFHDRSLKVGAVTGEIIMLAKLGEPGVHGASAEIPDGMRVVTVPVDLTKTHSGLIRPGDRVDVLLTYSVRTPGEGPTSKVRTVLEYIKVFAADNLRAGGSAAASAENSEIKAKNISLLVEPDQANRLMMASSLGALHLALRHKKDSTSRSGSAITLEEFEGITTASKGEQDPFEKEPEPEKAPAKVGSSDVQSALRQELAQQSDTVEAAVVDEPTSTWKVHIYAGGEHRVEEVELPKGEQPAVNTI